jgi:hypothetical protein
MMASLQAIQTSESGKKKNDQMKKTTFLTITSYALYSCHKSSKGQLKAKQQLTTILAEEIQVTDRRPSS